MTKRKISQIVAFINLLVVFVLVTDTYLLPMKEYPVSAKGKNMEYTKERVGYRGYSSYLIRDQNGIQYSITENSYYSLNLNAPFTVVRTSLFRKAIKIRYDSNRHTYSQDIGVINETFFGVFVLAFISLVSLILILVPNVFKSDYVEFKTTIAITSITIVAIYFYFHHQS